MWCVDYAYNTTGDVVSDVVPRYVPSPQHKKQNILHIVWNIPCLSASACPTYLGVYTLLPHGVDGLEVHSDAFLLNMRRKASEVPLTYGIVTLSLDVIGLSRHGGRCWDLSLLTRWNCQSKYPHSLSTSLMFSFSFSSSSFNVLTISAR